MVPNPKNCQTDERYKQYSHHFENSEFSAKGYEAQSANMLRYLSPFPYKLICLRIRKILLLASLIKHRLEYKNKLNIHACVAE